MTSGNSTLLVICLVVILLVALLANYYAHQMQEQKLQRTLLAKKLRFEAGLVLDALATLKQLQCPAQAIELLNSEVVEILEKLTRLKPQSGMIEQIQSQIPTAADQQQSLNLENESAMKKAHSAIRFAIRFVHQRRSLGSLPGIQCDEITKQLQWLDTKIEVDTHIELGKRLLSSDKTAVAISRFKQAKGIIARLTHKDPRKAELMAEVNQLIAEALPFGTPTAAAEAKIETVKKN